MNLIKADMSATLKVPSAKKKTYYNGTKVSTIPIPATCQLMVAIIVEGLNEHSLTC